MHYAGFFLLCIIGFVTCTDVEEDLLEYRLYKNMNPDKYITLNPSNNFNYKFSTTAKYVILCHDTDDGFNNYWYPKAIKAFMSKENYVVIAVQYTNYVNSTTTQEEAGEFATDLGTKIGKLLLSMAFSEIQLAEQVEMVGHGVGAHVAAGAAGCLQRKTDHEIKRLFGLDPANSGSIDMAIEKVDSNRTIIFHTSVHGVQTRLGHLDFYPNGGKDQVECQQSLGLGDRDLAAFYFVCSIHEDCRHWGTKCENFSKFLNQTCAQNPRAKMGYNVDDDAEEGGYYASTSCWRNQHKVSHQKNPKDIRTLVYKPERPNMYNTRVN